MQKTTFSLLTDAFVNCTRDRPLSSSALTQIHFWREQFGPLALEEITPDHVDEALIVLTQRGKLQLVRGFNARDLNRVEDFDAVLERLASCTEPLTVPALAKLFASSVHAVRKWRTTRDLPAPFKRPGDRRLYWRAKDLIPWARAERERLASGPWERSGQPLKGSTVNRYLSTLGELFKAAARLKLVKRSFVSPLAGLERAPEPVDSNRYFRPEEIEKLIKIARVLDRRWGKLACFIRIAFVTGLRIGALQGLPWLKLNFEDKLIDIGKTKNGDPIIATLNEACIEELRRLSIPADREELVFCGRKPHRAHNFRRLWAKVCEEAGLPGRNIHQIRHGTGSFLAMSNVNQAGIMAVMGHRTLAASRRYMHHNVSDKRAITERVFGK